jgi:beta-glucosidase
VTTYSEGIDIGYRWFDRQNLTPLFPFGYGLSYSDFSYSKLKVRETRDGDLSVRFVLMNHGARGEDVPQVYLGAPAVKPAGVQFAVKALAAFDRVDVPAGRSVKVTIEVPRRELSYWSTAASRWTLAGGKRALYVGPSSRDLRLATDVSVK